MGKFRLVNQNGNIVWLFVLGLMVLFIPIFLIVWKVLQYTHGVFMYPFDDTFIHLTIADNLLKGNWGVNQNEFASASSSILYTLILTLFRAFSHSSLIPFIVNCLSGVAILVALYFWLKKHFINYAGQGAISLLVIFFTPLPLMIISGMEHTLQCLFSFLFIFYFSDWLEESKNLRRQKLPLKILLFAVLLSTIRYEGIFLVVIACLLLLGYRKIIGAIILGSLALAPLVIFGLIAQSKGNYFLPNSVLIKSGSFNYSGPAGIFYDIFFEKLVYARNGMAALATQRLLIILPLLYLLFRKYMRASYFFILIFLFGATILQLSFASTGYLYRYEAYLFFCFMIISPVLFYKYGRVILVEFNSVASKIIGSALIFFLIFPVVLRSVTALDKSAQACINIYDQQYQMAMFTNKFYNQSIVALNDIGAVSYFTNAKIIDLWGLANTEVARSKKQHYWTSEFLNRLCNQNDLQMAIIYDSWFPDSLSKKWTRAATWQIQNNIICGDSIVSFYSMNLTSKNLLQQKLRLFQNQLPSSVEVKYY
jgi:hypothetical protein